MRNARCSLCSGVLLRDSTQLSQAPTNSLGVSQKAFTATSTQCMPLSQGRPLCWTEEGGKKEEAGREENEGKARWNKEAWEVSFLIFPTSIIKRLKKKKGVTCQDPVLIKHKFR